MSENETASSQCEAATASGTTESHRLTRDEIIAYYTEKLLKPELQKLMHANFRYTRGNLRYWDTEFLAYLKPLIDQNTDDSRSLLLGLIEPGAPEEEIRRALAIQKMLPGLSFAETAVTLRSLSFYPKSGVSMSFAELGDSPQHLVALNAITSALATIDQEMVRWNAPFIGKNQVLCIRDEKLLGIILEHPEYCTAIAQSILDSEGIRYPAIHSIINGEAAPLSSGAL
jgi:hypothetical protein